MSSGDIHELAAQRGASMHLSDIAASRTLKIELLSSTPNQARMQMRVEPLHLNALGICHGGVIFTLADAAFSVACNNAGCPSVAAGCSIEFLMAVQLGDILTCEGTEQVRRGRHSIYDMKVSNQRGDVVALFRGKSTQLQHRKDTSVAS